ncbi:MAG: type II secretory pathway pseudopilin PulG [Kiritimatiellia bacterium]
MIEVVVSMLILAVGMTAVALSMNMSNRTSSRNKTESQALAYARMPMGNLFTLGYSHSNLNVGVHTFSEPGRYAGTYTISTPTNALKKIHLVLNRTNPAAVNPALSTETVELTSRMSEALH